MKEVVDFLKEAGVFYIATVDNDKPRVRPFGIAEIYEDKVYIQTGKIKDVSKQIEKNNNVEICTFKDGKWLRIQTKLIRDERIEAKKYILDQNPSIRSMYDESDDNTEVLYFKDAIATFYSFTEKPRKVEF